MILIPFSLREKVPEGRMREGQMIYRKIIFYIYFLLASSSSLTCREYATSSPEGRGEIKKS